MKRIAELTTDVGAKLRDRSRSTRRCLNQLGRAARSRGEQSKQRIPADSDLLVPSLDVHQKQFGQAPSLVAADAGFFPMHNEAEAHRRGVKQVAVPNLSTKSAERKALQHKRWFRKAMKWRTGCEGRISLLERRHGLDRCRYKGTDGMKRWVGLGVIADNLINIAQMLAAPPAFCAGK